MKKYQNYSTAFSPEDIAYYEEQRKRKIIHVILQVIIYLILILWAFLAVIPMFWTAFSSLKSHVRIMVDPIAFDFSHWTTKNFVALFSSPTFNVLKAFGSSIYTSIIIVIGTLIVAIMMGFALARLNFPGHRVAEMLVVACMMFPSFALIIPLFLFYNKTGLIDTHVGFILPQIALNMSFTTILLTGFFKSLPIEVEESAFLDGAGVARILIQIILPMMKSAIITCVIFVFLWSYNDLFVQNIVIRTNDKRLLGYIMVAQSSVAGNDYGKACAAATVVAVPMMVIYFFLQKHIIKGLTAGAVKG